MHPLNSRTSNAVAVKSWTFIGCSLKKYLYGIRLINRHAGRNASCIYNRESAVVTNSVDVFSYSRSRISPPFFTSDLRKKFQRYNNTLFCDSVMFLFFYVSSLVTVFWQNTCARIRSADPSDTPDATSHIPCYLYRYVSLFMIFIHLFGAALDCACSISPSRGKSSIQSVSLK